MQPRDRDEDLHRTAMSDEVEYHAGGSGITLDEQARGPSMTRGAIASSIIAAAIGWLPLLGPAIAGFVGGWITRSRIRGIYATQPAAIISIMWAWLWSYLPEIAIFPRALADRLVPMDLFLSGGSIGAIAALITLQYIVCLLAGWIGGMVNERRTGRSDDQWPRPA